MSYKIYQHSISKLETFEACALKWWFNWPKNLKPEQDDAQKDGDKGHKLIANYLITGQPPEGKVKMGTAVRRAIKKGLFPAPGPDLLVERRFTGQPMRDANGKWIPLDRSKAPVWLAGIPVDGFIDVMFRRDDAVTVEDHKFSSDIWAPWSKKADQLLGTIQMPIYALVGLSLWPDAEKFRLTHNNIARSGPDTDKRSVVVTKDQILERRNQIETLAEQMKAFASAEKPEDLPWNKKACEAYGGCPHQSRCIRFKEKNKVELSPEEIALFDGLGGPPAKVVPPDAPPNRANLPPPDKKQKIEVMPACEACGEDLNPENSSRLQDGGYKHIGCTAQKPPPVESVAQPAAVSAPRVETVTVLEGTPPKRGRKPIPDSGVVRVELGPETIALLRQIFKL